LKLVTIHLPERYLEDIEQLIQAKMYPNRSETIRVAIRDLLKSELWSQLAKEVEQG
jgi:antitoxin ParD1/3/4